MTERSAEAVLEVIRQFIIRQRGELPEAVTLDTPLRGLVDSFGLVDLGMEISRELDMAVLSGDLLPEDFASPRTLWTRIQEVSA